MNEFESEARALNSPGFDSDLSVIGFHYLAVHFLPINPHYSNTHCILRMLSKASHFSFHPGHQR